MTKLQIQKKSQKDKSQILRLGIGIWILIGILSLGFGISAFAADVSVEGVGYQEEKAGVYTVTGNLINAAAGPREVVTRAQLTFYDKTSPTGDVPAAVVRKDTTVVLRANETRQVQISIINEGRMPKGSFRVVPMLRIRREREWNY